MATVCPDAHLVTADVYQATHDSFDEVVINTPDDVLVDVWKPGCPACSALAPRVDYVANLLVKHGVKGIRIATMVRACLNTLLNASVTR